MRNLHAGLAALVSRVRRNTATAAIAAACALFLLLSMPGESSRPAEASHAGGMDAMSIDLDTAGNTATSLAAREECVEVSAGDSVTLDVTATNIPASSGMFGFSFTINYNDAAGRLRVESADNSFLLNANSGSSLFDGGDPAPDTNSNGNWAGGAIDAGSGITETGSGVLTRVVVSTDASTPAGEYALTLTNAIHVDDSTQSFPPDALENGRIAVDTPCAGVPEADVEVSAVSVSSPAAAVAGDEVTVSASATVHNLGPEGPAIVDVTLNLSIPPDCSTQDSLELTVQDLSLDASISTVVPTPDHEWDVTCSTASSHLFSVGASVVIDGTSPVDPNPGNDTASGQSATVFNAESDISMSSVDVTVPSLSYEATAFDVTATATLHNLGPEGPANVDLSMTITVPPECRVMNQGIETLVFQNLSLPTSGAVTAPASPAYWQVQCDHGLGKTITVSGSITLDQLHTTDPSPGNESTSGQGTTDTKIGICGDDPDPSGEVLQNPSPLLIQLIGELTDDGTQAVPAGLDTPLDCQMSVTISDGPGTPVDDCEVVLLNPPACTISLDASIDRPGGTPPGVPGPRLNMIPIFFVAPEIDFAQDLDIGNGSVAGSANFFVRFDATLGEFGTPCKSDLTFFDTPGIEGGIEGNVPESNDVADLTNPDVWPNDLNAERVAVESALDQGLGITLWSRMIVPLSIGTIDIPMNVLIWEITDPAYRTATDAGWVIVAFPGDAVGPDAPGTIGGDPDADNPEPLDVALCAPYSQNLTLAGSAGGDLRASCTATGNHMTWALIDPDASNYTLDDGPRSDLSPCSLDADGDGLTANEESHYGTNPNDADSDNDTVLDGPDNCKLTPNPGQANFDGDDLGDDCDPDVDGDGTDNGADLCPLTTPGQQADANGCSNAQVDDDADGVCDPGAPSGGPAGCTGSDVCPNTGTGEEVGPDGCSQAQVDADADGICDPGAPAGGPEPCTGTDNCPVTANPSQEDLDSDGLGDACDLDVDGDGVNDVDETGCGSDPLNGSEKPELTDPPGADEDGDGQTDEALPGGANNFDCDGDGYSGDVEAHVFGDATRDQARCGLPNWASDFITGGIPDSTDRINILDLASFAAPERHFLTSPGDALYDVRWDLSPGPGPLSQDINIIDLAQLAAQTTSGYPPMFGGQVRAFLGPTCN